MEVSAPEAKTLRAHIRDSDELLRSLAPFAGARAESLSPDGVEASPALLEALERTTYGRQCIATRDDGSRVVVFALLAAVMLDVATRQQRALESMFCNDVKASKH